MPHRRRDARVSRDGRRSCGIRPGQRPGQGITVGRKRPAGWRRVSACRSGSCRLGCNLSSEFSQCCVPGISRHPNPTRTGLSTSLRSRLKKCENAQNRRQRALRVSLRVGVRHQGGQGLPAIVCDRFQRVPEFGFERDTGAMAGQGKTALFQHAARRWSAQQAASATTGSVSAMQWAAAGARAGSAALPIA